MGSGPGAACSLYLNSVLTPLQSEQYQNTKIIRNILSTSITVAVVGCSTISHKASNMVASYLQDENYRIIPVNPQADKILGETCYPSLRDIPVPLDIVDIFRPASEIPEIVDEAIMIKAKSVWMQLRISDFTSAERALEAGLQVVIDKCIKMEHGRYSGGLHAAGMNTGMINAKRGERRFLR